jgi:hypothetical protein
VNTTALDSDGSAIYWDSDIEVSSNIIAWRSRHPLTYSHPFPIRYSLFDSVTLPDEALGVGNKVADGNTFFVDRDGKDFHLAATSPALGAGDPDHSVTDDFDGTPRPSPSGSQPDVGGYEAPGSMLRSP